MERIKALVVVYNISLDDSLTLSTIKQMPGVDIYVADNSTREMGNRALAKTAGYHYTDMGGNMGLSKAYNAVIDSLAKDDSLICIFDDDTAVDSRYFDMLKADAAAYPMIDVFAPIVKDTEGILSPCIQKGLRGIRVSDLSQLPEHGVSAVNSGLAVRLQVFKDYRYDEELFLDFVDHAFIRDVLGQARSKMRVMDAVLQQCFSASEKQEKSNALKRLNIYKKDAFVFAKKYGICAGCVRLLVLMRRVRLLLKYI